MAWKDGRVIRYRIHTPKPRNLTIKVNSRLEEIHAAGNMDIVREL